MDDEVQPIKVHDMARPDSSLSIGHHLIPRTPVRRESRYYGYICGRRDCRLQRDHQNCTEKSNPKHCMTDSHGSLQATGGVEDWWFGSLLTLACIRPALS